MLMKKTKKQELKKYLDKLWKAKCFIKWGQTCLCCGKPANVFHHYIPRSKSFGLTWDVMNGVPLCRAEHYLIHNSHNPDVTTQICNRIIDMMGKERYEYLKNHKGDGKDAIYWLKEQEEKLLND